MPLSDRPLVFSTDYYRVTKLAEIPFIPRDYKGTMNETRKDGTEYKTHLFDIYIPLEQRVVEFRATEKWLGCFNNFLTSELEKLVENDEITIQFSITGYGRKTDYHFSTNEYPNGPKSSKKPIKK